jgi:hypothetical protein
MSGAPLCPSATLDSDTLDSAAGDNAAGADGFGLRISGVVGGDGTVTNLRTPLPVDAAMRAELARHGAAERRFRFAAPCAERACGNWRAGEAGGQCALIGRIRAHVAASGAAPADPPGLQPCAIRARCRWWQQDAAAACAVCTLVTYNAADA